MSATLPPPGLTAAAATGFAPPHAAGEGAVELELELTRARALARRRMAWLRATWPTAPGFAGLAVGHEEADRLAAPADPRHLAEFLATDPPALAATEELAAADEALELLRAQSSTPLRTISRALRLTPLERDLLALAICVDVDPAYARLCAYLQDDATRAHLTVRLACDLLGPGGALPGASVALTARHRLRSLGLLRLEGGGPWTSQAIRVDERVLAVVAGDDGLDPRLLGAIDLLSGRGLPTRLAQEAERAAELIAARADDGAPAVLALTGEPTTPLHAVAAAAAAHLGLRACLLHPTRLASLPRAEAVALLEREAALCGLAYVVDEPLGEDWPTLGALVMITSSEPPADGTSARVDIGAPSHVERTALLSAALAPDVLPTEVLERIAGQFPLPPGTLGEAVAFARAESAQDGTPLAEAVWRACRLRARRRAPGLATITEPRRTWDDLVLPAPLVERLRALAGQVARRPVVYETWGFGRRLGRGRGITALFAGPSGTGKTLAAEVLAGALGVDLQRIDLAGVVDKYIGETEKHLRSVFDAAERSGALLFFDEADALFGKRTDVRDSHDRYANIEVDYLLQRMEDYPGLAVLATNRKGSLDAAFLRRLRFVVDFPFPDVASRRHIWATAFPGLAPTEGLDLDAVARLELSGGNISTVAVNAAFAAAAAGVPIAMTHIEGAARAEFTKLERLVRDGDFDGWTGADR